MIKHLIAPLALAFALSACAGTPNYEVLGSMTSDIGDKDLDTLAGAAVDLVRRQANPDSNVIGLQSAGDEIFTPKLVDGLSRAGYKVVTGERLRYQVGPLGENVMLRVSIDGTDSTQLYTHDKDGKLTPTGPLSVWSLDQ